eukprot:515537-Prorocentrum_lima.AAC.1
MPTHKRRQEEEKHEQYHRETLPPHGSPRMMSVWQSCLLEQSLMTLLSGQTKESVVVVKRTFFQK